MPSDKGQTGLPIPVLLMVRELDQGGTERQLAEIARTLDLSLRRRQRAKTAEWYEMRPPPATMRSHRSKSSEVRRNSSNMRVSTL